MSMISDGSFSKDIQVDFYGVVPATQIDLDIMDLGILQRLKHVKQLGLTYLFFPSGDYDRFTHSLCVMHTAELMARQLYAIKPTIQKLKEILQNIRQLYSIEPIPQDFRRYLEEFETFVNKLKNSEEKRIKMRLIGLTHDIGHYPYSHCLEGIGKYFTGDSHDDRTIKLLKSSELSDILRGHGYEPKELIDDKVLRSRVVDVMGPGIPTLVKNIQPNCDSITYLWHDRKSCGLTYGIDTESIIENLIEVDGRLCIKSEYFSTMEQYLKSLFYHFKDIYLKALPVMSQYQRALYDAIAYFGIDWEKIKAKSVGIQTRDFLTLPELTDPQLDMLLLTYDYSPQEIENYGSPVRFLKSIVPNSIDRREFFKVAKVYKFPGGEIWQKSKEHKVFHEIDMDQFNKIVLLASHHDKWSILRDIEMQVSKELGVPKGELFIDILKPPPKVIENEADDPRHYEKSNMKRFPLPQVFTYDGKNRRKITDHKETLEEDIAEINWKTWALLIETNPTSREMVADFDGDKLLNDLILSRF